MLPEIEFITECWLCAREFQPDRDDIRRGRWKTCPDCRPRGKDPPRRRPLDDPRPIRDLPPRADTEPPGAIVKESKR